MDFLGTNISPLGMGCWPIGGAMFIGDHPAGYTTTDDAKSMRTLHAALDAGITLFDTAAAYGAGHAERLMADAFKGRHDVQIVTKIGIAVEEATRQITPGITDPRRVAPAIDDCLNRLGREQIHMVLLHLNELPVAEAEPIFEAMEAARAAGKVLSYGWSTDVAASAAAMAGRPGFCGVEFASSIIMDAPQMRSVIEANDLIGLVRSPLGMGVLTGRYGPGDVIPEDDVRAGNRPLAAYFVDGVPNPDFLARMDAVREILMLDGRSLVQGALAWLWAKSPRNIPIPGASAPEQIIESAGAIEKGPLPPAAMEEIETLIDRATLPEANRPR